MGEISRKSRYHSTVGRRTFMKMLGMGAGAAGLGFAADGTAFADFKDVDDMISSPYADRNLPFWVKEVDEPTVEIDWDNMDNFPGVANTLFNPHAWGDNMKQWTETRDSNIKYAKEGVQNNKPGYSLRDRALNDANVWGWALNSSVRPPWGEMNVQASDKWEHPTTFWRPEDYGVPRHEGTPEENSRMLRVAGRILGAADMGFVRIDERIKKLLYGNIKFEDVEKGYAREDGICVLPTNRPLYAVCSVIPQSLWMGQFTDRMSWASANTAAYSRAHIFSNRMKVFLRGLGYDHYASDYASIGRSVPFGIMAGLGESSRAGILCSPQWGTNIRTIMVHVTDLPLAVTKPIDAGITHFCRDCMKCADMCPSGAIPKDREPFWPKNKVPWQANGYKGWYQDAKKCYSYMLGGEPDCSRCQVVCPFTKYDEAVMHDLVRMSIARAPMLNTIIRDMDDIFGYGHEPDPNRTPWDMNPMDIPLFGLDQSRS